MHWLDWAIVAVYLVYITYDGIRLTKKSDEVEGYFLANRSLPWWAVGLLVESLGGELLLPPANKK